MLGIIFPALSISAQSKFEIFNDSVANGSKWIGQDASRKGGSSKNSTHYIYVKPSNSPAEIVGLSIPIRENPGPGEYRYITFAWVKWGGEQIGIKLLNDPSVSSRNPAGKKFDYTYYAGKGGLIEKGIQLDDHITGKWMIFTRDLWKDFGDFTLTGVSFICPMPRDAGFDAVILGQNQDVFSNAPAILPSQVTESIAFDNDGNMVLDGYFEEEAIEEAQGVNIDWAGQIRAGGVWMYPLYFLAFVAIIIAVQRAITSRGRVLAPKKLRKEVRENLKSKNITGALDVCKKYPSTLAKSLTFIFEHITAGREAVSQTAGDIAVRDVRIHLSRIYPLSIIASLSPLLGLLGTIVGMIEAFGLVALYGDEGGSAILSDSISLALITTAAGLIIAIPCIAVYFIIKNRIMRLASVIEVEIENVITGLYINNNETGELTNNKTKEE
ncbi:MAG: MotA/TolQ/ExbB proton channel family protein [Prevotella sp.]|nr:MotA/TolQ/ExbB proton channel family protein [Prevotella sp.]